jgi:hypothetical protein
VSQRSIGTASKTLLLDASTPADRAAGRALLEDERTFIDLPNCTMFYVDEHEIVR